MLLDRLIVLGNVSLQMPISLRDLGTRQANKNCAPSSFLHAVINALDMPAPIALSR